MTNNIIRLIVPDSHGLHIDPTAEKAFLKDVKALKPDEVIWLGDHVDAGGTFSAHQRNYTNEMTESYEDDCKAANALLDAVQAYAPNAEQHYIYGNHETHVERWSARMFASKKDADKFLEVYGPAKALRLKERGIKWYLSSECYNGLSVPGTIRRGKCYFTHGVTHSKNCASQHLALFGANVVFGHVHTVQSFVQRTVTSDGFGAWCPGTLAKLQPLYRHTTPTAWSHGYGLQFASRKTGRFVHWNVPIMKGGSMLMETVNTIKKRAK